MKGLPFGLKGRPAAITPGIRHPRFALGRMFFVLNYRNIIGIRF